MRGGGSCPFVAGGASMYSVVLLMAITTGGESADGCRGCRGCCGCYSGCYCSCYGGGCRGCRRSCKCSCGCYGCYSYGCYSSCSCGGCYAYSSCYGGCAAPVVSGCAAGHLVSSQVIGGTVVAS